MRNLLYSQRFFARNKIKRPEAKVDHPEESEALHLRLLNALIVFALVKQQAALHWDFRFSALNCWLAVNALKLRQIRLFGLQSLPTDSTQLPQQWASFRKP